MVLTLTFSHEVVCKTSNFTWSDLKWHFFFICLRCVCRWQLVIFMGTVSSTRCPFVNLTWQSWVYYNTVANVIFSLYFSIAISILICLQRWVHITFILRMFPVDSKFLFHYTSKQSDFSWDLLKNNLVVLLLHFTT